jgi:hypothetical protein
MQAWLTDDFFKKHVLPIWFFLFLVVRSVPEANSKKENCSRSADEPERCHGILNSARSATVTIHGDLFDVKEQASTSLGSV